MSCVSRGYFEGLPDQVHGGQLGEECGLDRFFQVDDAKPLLEGQLCIELEVEVVVLRGHFVALGAVVGPVYEVHLVGEVLLDVVDLDQRADCDRLPELDELLLVYLHEDLDFVDHTGFVVQLGQVAVPSKTRSSGSSCTAPRTGSRSASPRRRTL